MTDSDLLQKAFKYIEEDEKLARQVINAAENKAWYKIKSIVEDVLRWMGYVVDIAIKAITTWVEVFGDSY
jgi:hypothetical protein